MLDVVSDRRGVQVGRSVSRGAGARIKRREGVVGGLLLPNCLLFDGVSAAHRPSPFLEPQYPRTALQSTSAAIKCMISDLSQSVNRGRFEIMEV